MRTTAATATITKSLATTTTATIADHNCSRKTTKVAATASSTEQLLLPQLAVAATAI